MGGCGYGGRAVAPVIRRSIASPCRLHVEVSLSKILNPKHGPWTVHPGCPLFLSDGLNLDGQISLYVVKNKMTKILSSNVYFTSTRGAEL